MRETWAIVPVKAFGRAKTRLRPALSESQCASIARLMAIDVLEMLAGVAALDRVIVLGGGADQSELARRHGCDFIQDDPSLDVSANVGRVAALPRLSGDKRLLYIPADMPHLKSRDVAGMLAKAGHGITICRASRDGGTNAMTALPASGVRFSFGSGSAARHADAAEAAGLPVAVFDDAAFQRDVDTPADLAWLCRYGARCRTVAWLRETGLESAVASQFPESIAS